MGKQIKPKVFLIGEAKVNTDELQKLIVHLGAPNWKSDAPSDAELLCEIYGRACYKSFGTELNPNIIQVRKTNKSYLKNVIEKVKKKNDGLQITGNKKINITRDVKIKTYCDHRIAMAFLVMGLASKKKIIIDNVNCIKTSFPNFVTIMKDIGANFSKKN